MNKKINSDQDAEKLLHIALTAGRILLKSGAEMNNVEDTVERICKSKEGIESIEVYSVITAIFATITYHGKTYTSTIREKNIGVNLDKVYQTNNFSRAFCNGDMSMDEALIELERIDNMRTASNLFKSFCAGVTSAFFAILFGGDFYDFFVTFIIGFIVFAIVTFISVDFIPNFLVDFTSGLLTAGFAAIAIKLGFGNSLDKIIIGGVMPYVPGVGITSAIRDMLAGDYVTGLTGSIKAVTCSIAIASGVGIVLAIYLGG